MPGLERPRIVLDLLEESLEELDALWERRENVLSSPDWNRRDLADLEERAEAHLDALRLGGAHTVDAARPALAGDDRGAAVAATLALMSTGDAEVAAEVVAALAGSSPPAREGVRLGLRHSEVSAAKDALAAIAERGEPAARAAACDVLAFKRLAPPPFTDLLRAADPEVRRLAIGAAGRIGGPWRIELLEEILRGGDHALRRAAFEASARLATAGLAAALRRAAASAPEALSFLGVLGDRADLPLLLEATRDRERAADALAGLGALGDPAAVPRIVELMDLDSPRTALAAGAAFVRITGAAGIEAREPLPPPADLPDDEKDFWEGQRGPDLVLARSWWAQHGGRFAPSRRWQAGRDVSRPSMEVLDALPLDARRDVFLGARAARSRHVPDLELEAATPAFRGGAPIALG